MPTLAKLKGGAALCAALLAMSSSAAELGLCRFNTSTMQFQGTAQEQARCLLRKVKTQGAGSTLQDIPAWLLERVGKDISISPAQMSKYLAQHDIQASQIGGAVHSVDVKRIRYFVIHDTSSPEFTTSTFEDPINSPQWKYNNLAPFKTSKTARKVNVVTNRVGDSLTLQDLTAQRPSPASKLEQNKDVPKSRPYFVHVENVQPRLKPAGSWAWVAPDPGFTAPQVERLALIYIVSSVRAGHWLIPALHFNVDKGVTSEDPHDDPQGFNLQQWVSAVASVTDSIVASTP